MLLPVGAWISYLTLTFLLLTATNLPYEKQVFLLSSSQYFRDTLNTEVDFQPLPMVYVASRGEIDRH